MKIMEAEGAGAEFGTLLRREPMTGGLLIRRVRGRYPAELVKQARNFWGVPEKHIREIVRVAGSTVHRYRASDKQIDLAASERSHRMVDESSQSCCE
ncbi:MAG: antitoxin Xre-like helix-turn-helix domain-containing protein [Thiotrichales bacterium]